MLVIVLMAAGWAATPAISQNVTYDVSFQGNWTTASTPGGVVGGAHFTTLIGGVHGSGVTFWQSGSKASAGVELVAELGSTGTFRSEVQASAHTLNVIEQGVSGGGTGTASFSITANKSHPLVTLLSMIGPSPDWFVGISGLSLLDGSDEWRTSIEVDLFPYDAGTEDGTEFSLSNPATSPQGTITSISGTGKFSNVRMARLTFTLRQPPAPTVSLSASPNPVNEGQPVTVSARLSAALTNNVSVPVTLTVGSAESGDIGTLTNITISGGQTTGTGTIQTTRDADEDDETFTVSLGSLPSSVKVGSPSSVEITIRDDGPPPPTVSLSASPNPVSEGQPVTVSARLSRSLTSSVSIPVVLTTGTTEAGDIGTLTNITISGGQTTGTGTIQTTRDADEDDETFTVSLGSLPSSVTAGSPSSVLITIRDDGPPLPTVSLSASPNPVNEGQLVTVSARLSTALTNNVSVPVTLTAGSAEPGDIGTLTNITISGGQTTGTGTIQTTRDADEDDETFTVSLGSLPSGVKAGSPSSVEITIRDDGSPPPTVSLSASPNPVNEGQPVTVSARLSAALTNNVSVPVVLTTGSAEPGDIGTLTNITITGGQTTGTGTIQTTQDADEDDETFTVSLGSLPSSVKVGSPSSVEITIRDDGPPPPTVSLSASPNPVSEGQPVTVIARLSRSLASSVSIPVVLTTGTTEAGDIGTLTDITISGGRTAGTGTIQTTQDADEDDETFTVSLGSLPSSVKVGSPSSVAITISDVGPPPPVNEPPTVRATCEPCSVHRGGVVQLSAIASDADGDEITYSWSTGDGTLTGATDQANTTWMAPSHAGTFVIQVSVMDEHGAEALARVSIQVINRLPILDAPRTVYLAENTDGRENPVVLGLVRATHPDDEDITFSLSPGSLRFAIGETSGELRYIGPGEDFEDDPNQLAVTVVASDTLGGTAQAAITVQIVNVNERPAVADDVLTLAEDQDARAEVLTNDYDPDAGDRIHVVSVGSAEHGQTSLVDNGAAVRYVPDPNFHGLDLFIYVVSDMEGLTDTATVRVTVTPVNDRPSASDDRASTMEDLEVEIPVLGNDTDLDGDSLHVQSVSRPAHGVAETAPDRMSISYAPDANYFGTDAFTYVIADAGGLADTAIVRVTVTAVNDVPLASDDQASTQEDVKVEIPVLSNDTDLDGDPLQVRSTSAAEHGTLEISLDGTTVSYTPNLDYNGPDAFVYVITDTGGLADTAQVRVTVTPVNDAPVASDDEAATSEDEAVEIHVLNNDTDIDEDALRIQRVSVAGHGTAEITSDRLSVTYAPEPNYHGEDQFTYVVADVGGLVDTATVRVRVASVNDPPIASDDAAVTLEDESIEIPVLGNDTDLDGDMLRVQSVSPAEHGMPQISSGGTMVSYTPDMDYNGPDMFTYVVADAEGLTDTAMVAVTVTPVNDGPAAIGSIPDQMLDEGGSEITIDVTPYFTDTDGDPLTFSAESSDPSIATAAISGVELVLAPVAFGEAAVTVTATDRGGLTATQRVSVSVSDQPVRSVLGDAFAALARSHLASVRMTLERRVSNNAPSGQTDTNLLSGLRVGGRPVALPNSRTLRAMAQRIAFGWLPTYPQMGNRSFDREHASGMTPGTAPITNASPQTHAPVVFRNPLHLAVPGAGMSDMDFTFTWTGPHADSLRRGVTWSAWGQSDLQRYGGATAGSGTIAGDYKGNLNTWYLGVDAQLSNWLFGIAMGRSQGESDWTAGTAAGQLTTTITSMYPYLRWSRGPTNIWATAGMGRGEARNERAIGRIGTSPLRIALGLLDYRRQLGPTDGPVALGIRADAGWTSLSTIEGSETINDIQARVHQARLGLDVRGKMSVGRAGFAPFGAVHARLDGGDGQTGQGIEISGGFQTRFSLVGLGLQGRWLAFHSAADFEESGFGLTLTVGGQNEEGFSLTAAPHWGGHTRAGVALWQDRVPGMTQGPKIRPQGWTLDINGAYRRRLGNRMLEFSAAHENSLGGPNLQVTGLISL